MMERERDVVGRGLVRIVFFIAHGSLNHDDKLVEEISGRRAQI